MSVENGIRTSQSENLKKEFLKLTRLKRKVLRERPIKELNLVHECEKIAY